MKWIWESRKMRKNRWSKVWLEREKSTAPPACLVVKSGECIFKALTLPCTWKQEVDERGAKERIRWEEPSLMTWVLLWGARSSDISSRAAQETNLPRAGHKWTGGDLWEWGVCVGCGGEVCWSFRLSRDYTRKNSNVIRHRRDRDWH